MTIRSGRFPHTLTFNLEWFDRDAAGKSETMGSEIAWVKLYLKEAAPKVTRKKHWRRKKRTELRHWRAGRPDEPHLSVEGIL